jgi:lipoprotein-releasing system permease protein
MINKIATLVAWRYLWHKDKDSNIAVMIKVCFTGILIGTFALMLTLIITNGFEKAIHEKMRGINAQILISSPGNKLDPVPISDAIKKNLGPDLVGVSGNSIKQAILDDDKTQTVLFLKGIDPATESSVTSLAEKIIRPQGDLLTTLLADNNIIVGHKTAQEHNLTIGQTVTLLIPKPDGKKKLALQSHAVTVAGIFKIGLEEYDNNLAFLSLDTLNELFDEQGVDHIIVKLARDDDSYEKKMITRLKQRLGHLTIQSWKDLYPALVASLKLEKYVMFFILALITLVASMNMISLLFMQIAHKRRDIAIFKATGLADKQIRAIFLRMGLTITVSASLCGLALAALAGYTLERYPFIQLPDVYYISYLPARMDWEIFTIVFVVTLIIGFLATWFVAQRSTRINIAQVLRQE